MLVARLVGALASRVRQPRVVGEIVADIVLGPSLLGFLLPGLTGYMFPAEVVDTLRILADFGLMLFMFLIGLELHLRLLRGGGHAALLISHVSIVLPFCLGLLVSFGLFPLLGDGSFTGFSLFMGAALAITAFPVLARVLGEVGLERTALGTLVITCAAVDDVTAWCLLAVVVGVVKADGAADAVMTIGLALGFVALMTFAVRPAFGRLVDRWRTQLETHASSFMAVLIAAALLSASATERIGIHALFGAFLLGAVIPRSPGLLTEIDADLKTIVNVWLLPLYCVVVGLSTKIGLLDRPAIWLATVVVIGVAVMGKWGGCVIAGRVEGQSWRDATAIGIPMNTRGLTELVILSVGRELGVISPTLFTIMVLMALLTTLMATPPLLLLYGRSGRGPAGGPALVLAGRASARSATSATLARLREADRA